MLPRHVIVRSLPVLVALLLLGGWPMAGQSPPPTPLRLLTPQGARPLPSLVVNDAEVIALDELATVFPLTIRDDRAARAITVTWKGKTAVITPDQSLASVGGRLIALPSSPIRIGGKWFVPIDFLGRVLPLIADGPLEFRRGSRLLVAGGVRIPKVTVRYELPGPQARVSFDIAPPAAHTIVQETGRLLVRFEADTLDASIASFQSQGLVTAIHPSESGAGVVLELGPRFASFRASDLPGDAATAHFVIDIFPATEAPPVTTGPAVPEVPALPTPTVGVRVVVLDPGHGGADTGAHGAKGITEKDLTLAVARRLKAALESRIAARVLLTRDDDKAVSPDDRAAVANNNKGDLFVSLHAGGSAVPTLTGASVYYLALEAMPTPAGEPPADSVAMPVFGGGTREIAVTPWRRAQAPHVADSAAFARRVEAQLRASGVLMSRRPLQAAPLRVLIGANMPAILVELGYLTNPDQQAAFGRGEVQARLAQSLADAIVQHDTALRSATAGAPR